MIYVDLHFLGHKRVIATALLEGPSGLALVDPGPSSCLLALESGLLDLGYRLDDVRTLLLTHIHLDHAGASGTLMQRLPKAELFVHERGAPHMVDPTKLLSSATRLYGADMERLWGEFRPVSPERMRVLQGGERLDLAGRTLDVAYTPGHASHHVSYLDTSTGVAYVGDTCGIRVATDFLIAPTPPPDIDLETWTDSLATIEAWRPATLFLTHFGPSAGNVGDHVRRFRTVLEHAAARVRATLEREGTDEERIQQFIEEMRADVRRGMPEEDAVSTEMAAPFAQLWQGLARYWRKKSA